MQTDYRILKYLRLSLDDENDGESNSITMQREYLDNYIDEHFSSENITVDEIVDDGYSGTNFKRPGITKALNGISSGKYNCLIVKDFSRFGRDHIQVGNYLEHIFPSLNVRVISVNDNYDSKEHIGSSAGIDVALKNLIYELYSKDMSMKIRSARRALMKSGKYNAPTAMYGYHKKDGGLVVDINTAPVIKRIFNSAKEMKPVSEIVKELNADGIPSPGEYKRINKISNYYMAPGTKALWTNSSVNKILRDKRYTGTQILGRYATESMRENPKLRPIEECIVFENAHESIISNELFEEVSSKLRTHKSPQIVNINKPHIYKCGGCFRTLCKDKKGRLICRHRNMNYSDSCISDYIYIDQLNSILYEIIKKQFLLMVDNAKSYKSKIINSNIKEKQNVEKEMAKLKKKRFTGYEEFKNGTISKDDFDLLRNELAQKMQIVQDKLAAMKDSDVLFSEEKEHKADLVIKYDFDENVDESFIEYFIKEVIVFRERKVKITWKFGLNEFLPLDSNDV